MGVQEEVAMVVISIAKEYQVHRDFPAKFGLSCFRTSVDRSTRRTMVAAGSCFVGLVVVAVDSEAKEEHTLRRRLPVGNFFAVLWNLVAPVRHYADRR